jgi:predicted dienelactone hydrolase
MGRLALWGVAAGAAAVAILLVALWIEHFVPVTLPSPTGLHAVGRRVFDWHEDARDTRGPGALAKRELLVWVWYPAAPTPGTQVGDFLPAATVAELRRARGAFISDLLNHDLTKVGHHSFDNAPFARVGTCPVILLRGGASSEIWNLSSLAEELASHGYVVVGIDAAAKTNVVVFSDGRVVRRDTSANPEAPGMSREHLDRLLESWVADMKFTVDRLATLNDTEWCAHHLDLKRIGAAGHSFGGAQVAEFCVNDARCRCGINLDGMLQGDVVTRGVPTPFMFLLADHHRGPEPKRPRCSRHSIRCTNGCPVTGAPGCKFATGIISFSSTIVR